MKPDSNLARIREISNTLDRDFRGRRMDHLLASVLFHRARELSTRNGDALTIQELTCAVRGMALMTAHIGTFTGASKWVVCCYRQAAPAFYGPIVDRTSATMMTCYLNSAKHDKENVFWMETYDPNVHLDSEEVPLIAERLKQIHSVVISKETAEAVTRELSSPGEHFGRVQVLEDPTPYVRPSFTARMSAEIIANKHQGEWETWQPNRTRIATELDYHMEKLMNAIISEKGTPEHVSEYAADVANLAMKEDELYGVKAPGICQSCGGQRPSHSTDCTFIQHMMEG